MTETKLKIAIRRYSSPHKNNNQDKNDISFIGLFQNINMINRRRMSEKKAPSKYTSNTR